MPTPPHPTAAERGPEWPVSREEPRSQAERWLRPGLSVAGLILVTACRMGDATGRVALPATWLLTALLVLTGWTCPRRVALGAALISLFAWCGIEASEAAVWTELLPGQLVRLVVGLWLVAWTQRLRERLARAHRLVRLDSLTELPNRLALAEALDAELSRMRRSGRPFTVVLFDGDDFKAINDGEGGHDAGDEVLRRIGRALWQYKRGYECAGRLHGDEFMLVLSDADSKTAKDFEKRLRDVLLREVPMLTFSMGVVTFCTADRDWKECVHLADVKMYEAKKKGKEKGIKGQTEFYDAPPDRPLPPPK